MSNDINWPNPERPGVPMFPERKAWHMLDRNIWEWCPSRQAWNDTVLHPSFVKAKAMAWRKYQGIVLTPTQLTELLAGERERCAKLCEDAYEKSGRDFEYLGCNDAASQIRNLGAAP